MEAAIRILADSDPFDILIACFFLLVFVVAGAYAVRWLRKQYWGPDELGGPGVGFTIGDLRHLHKSGQLSDEEFQKAKEKIVAAHQAAGLTGKTDPPRPPGEGQ
jgi:hypothetical protein